MSDSDDGTKPREAEMPLPILLQRQRLEPRLAGAVPVAKRGQCSWAPLTASKSSCILPHLSTHRNTGPSGLILLTQNCGTHSMTRRCTVHRDTNKYAQRHLGLYPKSQHMSYRQDCHTSNAHRQQTHTHTNRTMHTLRHYTT